VRFGDKTETVASNEVGWGNNGPNVGLTVTGSRADGNMGLVAGIDLDGGGVGLGDNAKVWIKPWNWFKITLGKYEEDDLRYKIGVSGGGFHNYMLYIRGDNLDENQFLSRFNSDGFGAHVTLTPIENLYIGVGWGSTFGKRSVTELREDGAADVWANAQVGLGYKIPNVGFARFMFNGKNPINDDGTNTTTAGFKGVGTGEATSYAPSFQLAFQLTAVKGLNIDIGGKIPLSYDYTSPTVSTVQPGYVVGLGFDYTVQPLPALRFYGRASYKFGGYTETTTGGTTTKVNDGNDFVFILTPMYTVARNLILGFEFVLDAQSGSDLSALDGTKARGGDVDNQYGAYWVGKSVPKNDYLDIGLGLYLRKNIPGGDIRVGATVKLPGGEAHEGAKPQLFFPIMFNYGF
jgi:hypothetical protein